MSFRNVRAKLILIAAIALSSAAAIFAAPTVSADVTNPNYSVGDLVTLRVNVSQNSGMHGVFFDLKYDGAALAFVSLDEGAIPKAVEKFQPGTGRLLYAVSDPVTSATIGQRVIVSFAMNGETALTSANGTLVEMKFRVIAASSNGNPLKFTFNTSSSAIFGSNQTAISGVSFIDSTPFSITAGSGAYVHITEPFGNDAVYADAVEFSAISTAGTGYTYKIINEDALFMSDPVSAQGGSISNFNLPVVYGLNRLKIELRNSSNTLLATDSKIVYRSDDEVFVKIVSPSDHALVNTDMVNFLVTSPLDAVTVNGQTAEKLSEKYNGQNLFSVRLWLKKGFNDVVAKAVGPQGQNFTHTIAVYYQKDESAFRLVEPLSGVVIKADPSDPNLVNGNLRIRGEIGSAFKSAGIPNTVTLRVLYRPRNPVLNSRILVQDRQVPITESTFAGSQSQAPYMFTSNFDLRVDDLESGEIEIVAYKNKQGTSVEAELHRIVYIDRSRLSIDLVQPNIFGTDVLDTQQKITGFNNAQTPNWGNLELQRNGRIGLAAIERDVVEQSALAGKTIADFIETKDGTRYALVNENNVMRLYMRKADATSWGSPLLSRDDIFGYTLCETDIGILIGASNLFSSDNSGLYILQNGVLKNITIEQPIPHVQFIQNKNGVIYLYGNDYSNLYSFNIYSLEDIGLRYKAGVVQKVPFDTDLFIRQFELSDDGKTAIVLANDGKAFVYQNLYGSSYVLHSWDDVSMPADPGFKAVIKGEYTKGSYNAYVLLAEHQGSISAQVIMEHKDTHRIVMSTNLQGLNVPGETLLGVSFASDRFVFMYKKAVGQSFEYNVRRGNVLFNKLTFDAGEPLTYPDTRNISPGQNSRFGLLVSHDETYTLGFDSAFSVPTVYQFLNTYPQQGTVVFDYRNSDAEAVNGFSFQVDPAWINSTDILLAFGLFDSNTETLVSGTQNFSKASPQFLTLKDFLALQDRRFKIRHAFDAVSGTEIVNVDFENPERDRYISFALKLKSVGTGSRSIANLTAYKKVAVKIPRTQGSTLLFPIQGFVSDPTVTEIKIQEATVPLERNGYFSYPYQLNTTQARTTITLTAFNAAGQRVSLSFDVSIFDSINGLTNVALADDQGPLVFSQTVPNETSTTMETIKVSGNFYALEGAVVGYESFAYTFASGVETLKKIGSGIFTPVLDIPTDPAITSAHGTGYISGQIQNELIPVLPGKQRVIVYVENPGGVRAEYSVGGQYPDVVYNLPVDKQKIELLNTDIAALSPSHVTSGVTVDKAVDVAVSETATEPYVFKRTFNLSGRINSLFRFTDLKIKSANSAVLFSNGTQEIVVPVDELNRFEVDTFITVPEMIDSGNYDLLLIPTAPFLEWMKTGITLKAQKDYKNSYIVPDFSPMTSANWTPAEKTVFEKPLRIGIQRHLPSRTNISLSVNYEAGISGFLVEEGTGSKVYRVVDGAGAEVKLSGVKNGRNRIRWELSRDGVSIASSISGRQGMSDYFLDLDFAALYTPTVLTFPVDAKSYYDANTNNADGALTLPSLSISKQINTDVRVYLNDTLVSQDSQTQTAYTIDLKQFGIREGVNKVKVLYSEKSGDSGTKEYTFVYDTKTPVVQLTDYSYNNAGNVLTSFGASIAEANLQTIQLLKESQNNNVWTTSVVSVAYQLQEIGDQTFRVLWTGLDQLNPPIYPTATDRLFVRVVDYTNKTVDSEKFIGVTTLPTPAAPAPVGIPIGSAAYNASSQLFAHETENWGDAPFTKRMKVYNANIGISGLDMATPFADTTYTIKRSGTIEMNGPVTGFTSGKTLTLSANQSVVLKPGFTVPLGATLNIPRPDTQTVPVSPTLSVSHAAASTQLGIGFWFRYEPEPFYVSDVGNYRKILTVAKGSLVNQPDSTSDIDYEVYLAYKDLNKNTLGEENLVLVEWRGKHLHSDAAGVWASEQQIAVFGEGNDKLVLEKSGKTGWNLITVGVDSFLNPSTGVYGPVFKLSVNQQKPIEIDYATTSLPASSQNLNHKDRAPLGVADEYAFVNTVLNDTLKQGAVYFFGNQNGSSSTPNLTSRNGHFSIAQPFYVNKTIVADDVYKMAPQLDAIFNPIGEGTYQQSATSRPGYYRFNQNTTDYVGTDYLDLRTTGTASDFYSPLENADYSEISTDNPGHGSLRATSLKINRLKKLANGSIVFADATSAVPDRLTVTDGGAGADNGWLLMEPTAAPNYPGRYSFANNFGSHSVTNDRWYSVYGKVAAFAPSTTIDASLVLVINNVEKRYPLTPGEFHFVYQNEAGAIPTKVVMYIETKSRIKLYQKMFFTEGNYRLPDEAFGGLSPSAVRTTYLFQKAGTIDFWYKPMQAEQEGFVDYPVTLIDSEFLKIDSVKPADSNHTVFHASLSGLAGLDSPTSVDIDTKAPVRSGWQHVQLSWDHAAKVAYLYINGKLAGKREGVPGLPVSGTMLGYAPATGDNLFIGSNAGLTQFANGFLDDIRIDNWYANAKFSARDPITSTYTDGFDQAEIPHPSLVIQRAISGVPVEQLSIRLSDSDGTVVYAKENESIDAVGLDIKDFGPGTYKLAVRGLVNGYRFENISHFVKNDRPRFILNSNTSLIVSNDPADVKFNFTYDKSYLLKKDLEKFAGLKLDVSGKLGSTPFTKTYYVVQDFTSFDHNDNWRIYTPGNNNPEPFTVTGNSFTIEIPGLRSTDPLHWTYRPFYFSINYNFSPENVPAGTPTPDSIGDIALASLDIERQFSVLGGKSYEYKLEVSLGTQGLSGNETTSDFSLSYSVISDTTGESNNSATPIQFNNSGKTFLYYDDLLKNLGYGTFSATLRLVHKGIVIASYPVALKHEAIAPENTMVTEKRLNILELSLLQINKNVGGDTAELYLAYDQSGFLSLDGEGASNVALLYDVTVYKENGNGGFTQTYSRAAQNIDMSQDFALVSNIPLQENSSLIRVSLYESTTTSSGNVIGLSRKKDLLVSTKSNPPQVVLTNSVSSRIAYNNVRFSWIGYHDGAFKPEIAYSYNFDDKGWSSVSPDWRSVEYFGLAEGYHSFRVRAHYGQDSVSPESVATFFVDVNRPVVDESKIQVQKLYDEAGFLYAVNISGAKNAVSDASLDAVLVNDKAVQFNPDGSFVVNGLPILVDGDNLFKITAYDSVGNFTDRTIKVANGLTEIMFPQTGASIRYAPVTVVGRMPAKINSMVDIYLRDAMTPGTADGNFAGWHKARMNEDFTFFIEDVSIHPGARDREVHTPLEMAVVSKTGHIYKRTLDVFANEVTMPIDLVLSTHAVEGQNAETQVSISATAKVGNISSWSIDFTGDEIYDDVAIADNPGTAMTHSWVHVYSSLGLVKPRVRVVTKDGNYFSVSDEIIIHETIREASNKAIVDPISLAATTMEDNSQRLFVLAGKTGSYRVEAYEIGRNESFVSNKLFQFAISALGIENPVKIVAIDSKTLLIAEKGNGMSHVHMLKADEFDAFNLVPSAEITIGDVIADMDVDQNRVYLSFENANYIMTADIVGGVLKPDTLKTNQTQILNERPLNAHLSLSKDSYGILISDYYNQRVVRLSDSFANLEYRGGQGTGEGEFIKPSTIESYQNRIFVYDEGRFDIQVFDPDFKPIARLKYDPALASGNYLDQNFLQNLTGMSVFTRVEGNRLFYYATLLSASSNKLAVLRMPQWEEMRATVRNNRIIFLKDNEVYSAKPNGADLARLISSDSIPRISGSVDYPTLSPDGKMLAFTSRAKLYDGSGLSTAGTTYAYDNLYTMSTDGKDLTRIPMSAIQGFEIERPEFNSNGTKLIFSAKPTGGKWQIYVYTFETGSVVKLFSSDENARFPYYSPDDRFIAFTTDYDGDEDIQIFDTLNPSMRVSVTNNRARDSFPVWSVVYPGEIPNPDLKIESKIAFVSERQSHKGVYYLYVSRPSESDIRIVKKTGEQTGNQPDQAAIELTTTALEGDYPSFTGDGTAVVFEHFDGSHDKLMRYDFAAHSSAAIGLAEGSRRPAGMKNTIAQFDAAISDGNTVHLTWSRYTESDIFYTVRFRINRDGEPFVEKRVFTQDETYLTGLEMGVEYLFRVSIDENGEEAAVTQWKKVLIPEVAARPTFQIDANNPYLVHLNAWKPKDDTDWGFSWIIDNQEIQVQSSQDYLYEFGTSGTKTIILKAHNKANTYTNVSGPMTVDIVTDIKPVIEYVLASDRSYVELSALRSLGKKIDGASAVWTITGPGLATPQTLTGSQAIANIAGFKNKINVNLKLSRVHVAGQPTTDTIETNLVIDLDYQGTKLVITQATDKINQRLITFSGANSLGNINWREARWTVFRDGQTLYQPTGVSSFAYEFPETGTDSRYSVTLSVPRMSDGLTETVSNIVSVGATPMEPVIDYEVLELKNSAGAVTGAKVLFSAGNSKGNNIDFSQAKWTVPVAGSYGDQPTQIGPTAVYNLFNVGSTTQVEVSLTLTRRGSTEATTVTKVINVKGGDIAKPEIIVNRNMKEGGSGKTVELNVLASTGPNIDWEKTTWQFSTSINGQPQNSVQQGPAARIEIPLSAENTVVRYTVTLYVAGNTPLVKNEELRLDASTIKPVISTTKVAGGTGNVYNFSVRDTQGLNIDWERTTWSFYDGNENVVQKFGAQVTHAFVRQDSKMGYPVVVLMYFKNNAKPFGGYTSVDIEGDALIPVIQWDRADASSNSEILFTASQSSGSGIDWSQAKWTFGDGSQSQYGAAVGHKYPLDTANASYKVSLTVTRRLSNGESETATKYATVTVSKDEIKPVIRARYNSSTGTLVLSADESEGRGLMLERSVWNFDGKGSSENISESSSSNWNVNASLSVSAGIPFTPIEITASVSAGIGGGLTTSTSYSNENYQMGVVARRYIGGLLERLFNLTKTVRVSLAVYRADKDGKLVGKTLTVSINLADAAKDGGVTYR